MMFRIKNGEPVFHTHKCAADREGQVMTAQELHDFAVEVLMEEYGETRAEVVKCNKKSPFEPDFYFEENNIRRNPITGKLERKRVNVLVVYDDNLSGDISNIDTSWLVKEYRLYGIIPRITFASAWCIYGDDCEDVKPAICGGDFCFRYYSVSAIPDEKNEELDDELTAVELAVKYAETWQRLDASIVAPYLDKDFHYGSAWVFDEMPCRAEYLDYFRGKLKTIRLQNDKPRVTVARNHQTGEAGLILKQGSTLCLLVLEAKDGRIKSARMQEYSDRFKPFNPEDELYMVHGGHMEGIMPPELFFEDYFQTVLDESEIWKHCRTQVTGETLYEETTDVLSLMYGGGDIRLLSLAAYDSHNERKEFISLFPVCAGVPVEVRIEKVAEWDNQLEATVYCSIGKLEFAFFAIDYYCNKLKYQVGKTISVDLSALAMEAEEGEHGFFLEGEDAIDWLSNTGGVPEYDEDGNVEPVEFNMNSLVAFFDNDPKAPDEARFQSPVSDITTCSILGVDFYRAMITLSREDEDGRPELALPLYFRQDFFPDVHDGDPVSGVLWLSGSITGQHGQDEDAPRTENKLGTMGADFEEFLSECDFDEYDNLMFILPKLPQIHLHDGYEFDAFNKGNEYSSSVQPYCYKKGATMGYIPSVHGTYDDNLRIDEMISYSEAKSIPSMLPYFDVPFTEEGIMQAWLLYNFAEFLPKGWHANYSSKIFIFDKERIERLFPAEQPDIDGPAIASVRNRMMLRNDVMALGIESLLPKIRVSSSTAVMEYTYWNSWMGLVKATVNVEKDGSSIRFSEPKTEVLVKYDCGIIF